MSQFMTCAASIGHVRESVVSRRQSECSHGHGAARDWLPGGTRSATARGERRRAAGTTVLYHSPHYTEALRSTQWHAPYSRAGGGAAAADGGGACVRVCARVCARACTHTRACARVLFC